MQTRTKIDDAYNPEHDMHPEGPRVTLAEWDLQQQLHRVRDNLDEIDRCIAAIRRDLRMIQWGVAGTMLAILLLFAIAAVHLSN